MKSAQLTLQQLCALLGHTCLSPTATADTIRHICTDAGKHRFGSVLVNGSRVKLCRSLLMGTAVSIGVVCGFPLGQGTIESKLLEGIDGIENGADEVAFTLNLAPLLEGDEALVRRELRTMAEITHKNQASCTVIVETSRLNHSQVAVVAQIALEEQMNYFAPATGFGRALPSARTLRLLRRILGMRLPLWLLGGADSWSACAPCLDAGVARISCENTQNILRQFEMMNPESTR